MTTHQIANIFLPNADKATKKLFIRLLDIMEKQDETIKANENKINILKAKAKFFDEVASCNNVLTL